jgi:hypothetical protein
MPPPQPEARLDTPRTLITAEMIQPNTPVEFEMEADWISKNDFEIDWLDWYYEDQAELLNESGVSYEEWQKLHEQDIADFLAERAAQDAKTA